MVPLQDGATVKRYHARLSVPRFEMNGYEIAEKASQPRSFRFTFLLAIHFRLSKMTNNIKADRLS